LGIKITASREQVFRLHLAAPNDTIRFVRTSVSFRRIALGITVLGAILYLKI
jgi:hypothetical protein